MNFAFIKSQNGTLTVFYNGKQFLFDPSNRDYERAEEAVKKNDSSFFESLGGRKEEFEKKCAGKVTFDGGVFRYNGSIIKNSLADRLIEMVDQGYSAEPFVNFMEKCYENPDPTVIDRLYTFMEGASIMLDSDGFVVGYKGVRADGYDWRSGTVLYEVGKASTMPREKCDTDSRNTCSTGLHLGNFDYALGYANGGKLLLCRTNPKDVTAIPEEYGAPKLRACRIEVLADVSHLDSNERIKDYPCVLTPTRDSQGRFCPGHQTFKKQKRDERGRFV